MMYYHFTLKQNIKSIKEHGLLQNQKYCMTGNTARRKINKNNNPIYVCDKIDYVYDHMMPEDKNDFCRIELDLTGLEELLQPDNYWCPYGNGIIMQYPGCWTIYHDIDPSRIIEIRDCQDDRQRNKLKIADTLRNSLSNRVRTWIKRNLAFSS